MITNTLRLVDLRKRTTTGRPGTFSKESPDDRFWRAVDIKNADDCWEWMGTRHKKGYGEFTLPNKVGIKAHRYSWISINGEISDGLVVCHRCDNPPCCNPAHLFLGTHKTNKEDSIIKRRHAFGEKAGKAKLKESDVMEIRRLDKAGVVRLHLAKQFGISGRNVTSICRLETWRHI